MTTFTNFVLASAALLVSSGALTAQTVGTADVPFAFHVPGTSLPAGKYMIHTQASGNYIAQIMAQDTRKSVLVPTPSTLQAPYSAREPRPRLVFACRAGDCSLAEIWLGSDGVSVPVRPRRHSAGYERLAMISVNLNHAQ